MKPHSSSSLGRPRAHAGPARAARSSTGSRRLSSRCAVVHGLTQAQLALRAGTTQTALSRLERGELSSTVATVEHILFVLGETVELGAAGLTGDHDEAHLAGLLARPPAERLELAMSWNRLAGEGALAGERARGSS